MKIRVIIITSILLFFTDGAFAVGFDCSLGKSNIEKYLCNIELISKLENDMASAFKDALLQAEDKDKLKLEQNAWLKERNECLSVKVQTVEQCLIFSYRKRMVIVSSKVKKGDEKIGKYYFRHPYCMLPTNEGMNCKENEGEINIAKNPDGGLKVMLDLLYDNGHSCHFDSNLTERNGILVATKANDSYQNKTCEIEIYADGARVFTHIESNNEMACYYGYCGARGSLNNVYGERW